MTPQTVYDLAIIIGFGIIICVQHLLICKLNKHIELLKIYVITHANDLHPVPVTSFTNIADIPRYWKQ